MSDVELLTQTKPRTTAARMYGVVLGVGLVCACAIVAVFELTKPVIAENQAQARRQAIRDVLPEARTIAAFRLSPDQNFERTTDEPSDNTVFAGFAETGRLCGLAIETQGMGYQDTVRVLYGYSFDDQAVIGLRVLESRETPGLGDRVETDPAFLMNFQKLDVRLTPDGGQLANEIEFVKSGLKTSEWQIDGITGATITSRAIADMLRKSTVRWIPLVNSRRADFEQSATDSISEGSGHGD